MTSKQRTQVKSLLAQALEQPPAELGAWLRAVSGNVDDVILSEVRRLLRHAPDSKFLTDPPWAVETVGDGPAPLLEPGQVLNNRFRIQALLGAGGMGEVYRADDLDVREVVAVKILRRELAGDPDFVRRLYREVKIARQLQQHRNLCRVNDVHRSIAEDGPRLFVSMELLDGDTLARRLNGKPLRFAEILPIFNQIASGLHAVHEQGILHRDLKSANVILARGPDGGARAVITDFGLSREVVDVSNSQSLFGPNAMVGTPAYMAPEQLRGRGASIGTDIYSLGVIAFEMATGRLPFEGETPLAIALRRLEGEAPAVRTLEPNLPKHWDAALLACLSANPEHRPRTPLELAAQLEDGSVPLRYRASRLPRRAVVGGALTLLAATGVAYLIPRPGEKPPLEAVASFKRGEEFVRRRDEESVLNAIAEFRQAVALFPDYADAWASLAQAYCAASQYDFMAPGNARAFGEQAAREALSRNKQLAKAAGALAYFVSIDLHRWHEADGHFRKAIQLNPNEPLTHAWFAAYLGRGLHFNEAIAEARKALAFEPGSLYFNHQLAAEYFRARRFTEYHQAASELVRLQPLESSAHLALARSYQFLGSFPQALREVDEAVKYKASPAARCVRASIEASRGNRAEAERLTAELDGIWGKQRFETHVFAGLHAQLGHTNRVMQLLNEAYDRDDSTLLAVPSNVYMDSMKGVPAYQRFLRKLGFAADITDKQERD